MPTPATIHGPDPITLAEREGLRYWVQTSFALTGHPVVDERLSAYPVVVFWPQHRDPRLTPVVLGIQGMAAPYQWNAFLVPTLLDMGIACVLFDTPLAGERGLARGYQGDMVREVTALLEHGVAVETGMVWRLTEAVAQDFMTVQDLIATRHGLRDERRALFGVSLGTILAGYAFTRYGIGERLLGTIGHPDLQKFARSYAPCWTPLLASLPVRAVAWLAGKLTGKRWIPGAMGFLAVLAELRGGGECCQQASPMTHLGQVGPGRRMRLLVGEEDRQVKPEDAVSCAARFPDGECYVVPGLGHGGEGFIEHVRTFLGTQLGDWSW